MFSRAVICFSFSLILLGSQVYAASASTNATVVASAESSSQGDESRSDEPQGGESSDTQKMQDDNAKAASAPEKSQVPARREPEPLTVKGAIGLVLIIAAIGGFSYWAMRPLSRKSEDDEEDEEQA